MRKLRPEESNSPKLTHVIRVGQEGDWPPAFLPPQARNKRWDPMTPSHWLLQPKACSEPDRKQIFPWDTFRLSPLDRDRPKSAGLSRRTGPPSREPGSPNWGRGPQDIFQRFFTIFSFKKHVSCLMTKITHARCNSFLLLGKLVLHPTPHASSETQPSCRQRFGLESSSPLYT